VWSVILLRQFIHHEIETTLEDKGYTLSEEEMKSAIDGVEYWVTEGLYDSISDALSNVIYDREEKTTGGDNV
jgi:hypothetical protein